MTRSNALTHSDVCGAVRRWADSFRSEAQAARSIGITRQTLNEQTNAGKPFSDRVLNAAGIKRVVTEHYEFLEGA